MSLQYRYSLNIAEYRRQSKNARIGNIKCSEWANVAESIVGQIVPRAHEIALCQCIKDGAHYLVYLGLRHWGFLTAMFNEVWFHYEVRQ
jgi:hypothetical protein